MRARTINRAELTRTGKIVFNDEPEPVKQDTPIQEQEHRQGLSKCEFCGAVAVVHEGGCEHCEHCGWSKCG